MKAEVPDAVMEEAPPVAAEEEDDDEEEGEEETVYVQGRPVALSEVTEDDQNNMTKEEFEHLRSLLGQ